MKAQVFFLILKKRSVDNKCEIIGQICFFPYISTRLCRIILVSHLFLEALSSRKRCTLLWVSHVKFNMFFKISSCLPVQGEWIVLMCDLASLTSRSKLLTFEDILMRALTCTGYTTGPRCLACTGCLHSYCSHVDTKWIVLTCPCIIMTKCESTFSKLVYKAGLCSCYFLFLCLFSQQWQLVPVGCCLLGS